jgi:hypothetical protein
MSSKALEPHVCLVIAFLNRSISRFFAPPGHLRPAPTSLPAFSAGVYKPSLPSFLPSSPHHTPPIILDPKFKFIPLYVSVFSPLLSRRQSREFMSTALLSSPISKISCVCLLDATSEIRRPKNLYLKPLVRIQNGLGGTRCLRLARLSKIAQRTEACSKIPQARHMILLRPLSSTMFGLARLRGV